MGVTDLVRAPNQGRRFVNGEALLLIPDRPAQFLVLALGAFDG
jgi:hypothetical protein